MATLLNARIEEMSLADLLHLLTLIQRQSRLAKSGSVSHPMHKGFRP